MLEKYKLCPCCGKQNYPGLIECIDCEQDLTQVAITDSTADKAESAPDAAAKVRVCDACFAKNPPNARKCLLCGEDIADILPTVQTEGGVGATPKPILKAVEDLVTPEIPEVSEITEIPEVSVTPDIPEVPVTPDIPDTAKKDALPATVLNREVTALPLTVMLTSEDGSFSYTLSRERTVLGRSEEMGDYLSAKPYVSRVHCAITVTAEGVFLEDLNNTNYTFVNNTRAVGRVKLENGDSLSLGGLLVGGKRQTGAAYFTLTVV